MEPRAWDWERENSEGLPWRKGSNWFFGDPFRAQQVLKKGNPRRQTSDEKMVQLDR